MANNRSDIQQSRIAALAITLLTAVLIVLTLIYTRLGAINSEMMSKANDSVPENDEIFIDAEMYDPGQPEIKEDDQPSAAPQGEPEKGEEENDRLTVKDDKLPKESAQQPKTVTQKQASDVKVKQTSNSEKESKKISSKMGNAFAPHNGKTDGKQDGSGTGNVGLGVSGLDGRKRLTDPVVKQFVEKQVTIKIRITVNESGRVTDASFVSDSGPGAGNSTLRNACLAASKRIKWSKKEGKATDTGILTYKLTPPKGK